MRKGSARDKTKNAAGLGKKRKGKLGAHSGIVRGFWGIPLTGEKKEKW